MHAKPNAYFSDLRSAIIKNIQGLVDPSRLRHWEENFGCHLEVCNPNAYNTASGSSQKVSLDTPGSTPTAVSNHSTVPNQVPAQLLLKSSAIHDGVATEA